MKKTSLFFWLTLFLISPVAPVFSATVFTADTYISPVNTNYDGEDIAISNCTVTIDGPHNFNSLLVSTNGTLTHSPGTNGQVAFTVSVTNEQQVLSGINPATLLNTNVSSPLFVTDSGQIAVYTNGIDYLEINLAGNLTQIERTTNSSIPDGATVLVSYSWNDIFSAGLNLNIASALDVTASGSINANGLGYGTGYGPGNGYSGFTGFFDGSGGGDGGGGGMSAGGALGGFCNDSLYLPTSLGSAGGASYAGSGGNGGGLIQIVASGNINVDGVITANGANALNSRAGGGSGGGISISAASVSGAGNITANGGAGAPVYGGGGGGGRIAIIAGANNFAGNMTAYGAGGANYGGAGTIFTQLTGQTGLLLVNNGGNSGTNSTVSLSAPADVIVSGNAVLTPSTQFSPRNVTVSANSIISRQLTASSLIFSASNLTVQVGGMISQDRFGLSTGGSGGGANYSSGGFTYGGGGGHAGFGGAASITNAFGGPTYDSQTLPSQQGSAGGGDNSSSFGGPGGGLMQLTVSGTLEIDGRISANGGNGSGYAGGGGSGGSIYLSVGTLSGSGAIAANAGSGVNSLGGGGGGGRVAILCGTNNFTGTMTAYGGGGASFGGAGTVYLQPAKGIQQMVLDNAGNTAVLATPLLSAGAETTLIVQNGASGTAGGSSSVIFSNLLVAANASLSASPVASAFFLITSSATFQPGSTYNLNASGYPGNSGNGSGGFYTASPFAGAGGANGGLGGNSTSNLALGGRAGYQSIFTPNLPGSGGGGYIPTSFGGYGGGYMQMTVNGTLQMNGAISANGGNGYGAGGGGGAGGSINLSVGTLSGTGAISANGGNGVSTIGGGGGGGCIAIAFNTNSFAGTLSAYGGGGANYGGAGTIYFKTNSTGHGLLVIDNGGRAGAGSVIQSSSTVDLTVRSNSIVYIPSGTTTFANLIVGANGSIIATNYLATITANNITLQAGGSINANALGYPANSGQGAGRNNTSLPSYPCSGAGNGGYGGSSASNAVAGGTAVLSQANAPFTAGSGGGGYTPYSIGGNGGGAIELSVAGTVQLNGSLSANGGNGSGSGGGGGAGGSLYLTVGNLTGSGSISANGGSGANATGGGGAGGMIAINLNNTLSSLTNSFSGTISAYGGGGANYGGAGTIFIRTNFNNLSTFIVDNGGNRGTNTPLSYSLSTDALIVRNGALASPTITGINFNGILITSNAALVPSSSLSSLSINLYSNVIIQAGGGIIADSLGSAQNIGNGHGLSSGSSPFYPCSGGGHGGYGAFALSNAVPGGITYDSMTSPNTAGSGGGGLAQNSIGGNGGGIISLQFQNISSTLQVNGVISANGGNGSGTGGGGGSGGSIYLLTSSITGTGAITANGGNGALTYGGGGGGGRIVIASPKLPQTNSFTGTISAYGGGGANYGGAGTIYYQTNGQGFAPLLVLDNNGNIGTNTAFTFAAMNMTVQNGAIGQFPSSGSLDNILILSNSALTTLASSSPVTITASNVTIAVGGSFFMDGCGFTSQNGSGAGGVNSGVSGGAGHGGYGGGNSTNGGNAYDSIQAPIQAGSGGANYSSTLGGNGGGALTLNVAGSIVVNGRLSANGTAGGFNSGGGAGGSLYLSTLTSQSSGSISGNGIISANGGSATGRGGSGGGGRISLVYPNNNFTGQLSASGGSGTYPGGAGTIFTKVSGVQTLLVNNDGITGTNTPLSSTLGMPAFPFSLNISGAASVVPLTPLPLLSNLNMSASSTLTMPAVQSSLFIGVFSNATIAGNLNVDHLGYSQTNGPGAGSAVQSEGSGGGYGGSGGSSASGAIGGTAYGNPAQPSDFGSGGGNGAATATGGSDGGGALHLSVLGTLNLSGNISANGNPGLQDDSGGGSGGSVWIAAGTLSGNGNISAYGGNGVLYGGGGGSGGRIAIYTPTNNFTGTTNVSGGNGASPGQPGTIYLSNSPNSLQVISQSPTGQVLSTVSSVNLSFSDMLNPASVSASDFTLINPSGVLAASNLSVTVTGLSSVQVNFPAQNLVGNYTIEASTTLTSMFGQPLAQPYSGTFSILLPIISGTVTDTNDTPVFGVLLQPNGGLSGITTDVNGNYSLGVPTNWSGTVTPSKGTSMFVPSSLSYTNISGSVPNQNYLMVPTVAPGISTGTSGSNLTLNWQGIPGVTYQLLWSTNLMTWQPLGSPLTGTNGPMQIVLPDNSNSAAFFQINASY